MTVPLAALRVIGEEGPASMAGREVADELRARGWPDDDLRSVLVELVTEGVLLSVDGGYFTLHGYGYPGQTAPTPAAA